MRPDGLTVSASNAGADRGFVGRNYAFRPYFRDAMANGAGSQFALGTVSGRSGLYLSRRVGDRAGVVVVKIEFEGVEAGWRTAREALFVTDPAGSCWSRAIRLGTSVPCSPSRRRPRSRSAPRWNSATPPCPPCPCSPAGTAWSGSARGAAGATRAPARRSVGEAEWRIHSLTPITTPSPGSGIRRGPLPCWPWASPASG